MTSVDARLFVSLLVVSVLPNAVYVIFEMSSLAVGLLLASCVIVLINFDQLRRLHRKSVLVVFICSVLLAFHAGYIYLTTGEIKALSAIGLAFSFATVPLLSAKLANMDNDELEVLFRKLIHTFSVVGWAGLLFVFLFVGDGQKIRYPFPFSEPSFFALCYGIFAVGYSGVASWRFLVYMIFNLIMFAMLFPSLSFLVFAVIVLVVAFLRLKLLYILIGLFVFPLVLYVVCNFFILNNEYFSDRLQFSDTDNISTLVWLQGWDLAYSNLVSSKWLGLGIQMLGEAGSQLGEISYKLERLTGKLMNISSGGFLASKLISELGLLGVLISVVYAAYLFWFCLNILKGSKCRVEGPFNKKRLVLHGLIFGYVVEFYFRGYGYFSPGLYIVFASVMALYYMSSTDASPERLSMKRSRD